MHPRYDIFFPAIAMVLLTAIVWVRLYVDRIGELRARRIHPQMLATSRQVRKLQSDLTFA